MGQREKRAVVNYRLTTGPVYYLDSISTSIPSKDLDSIYEHYKDSSKIKEGQRFDLDNFQAEKDRLNNLFINNGIYKFQLNSVSFDIERDTTLGKDQKMPVKVVIDKNPERDEDSSSKAVYKVHHIKNVNIFADYSFNEDTLKLQSIKHQGYTIYFKGRLKYRPNALTDAIAILPGNVYKDSERSLTAKQISNLKIFKYPNINYDYVNGTDDQLDTNIYLVPRPRFSLGFSSSVLHSNIQEIGISLSTSLISRNVFRGAETLDISFRGTFGSSSDLIDIKNYNLFSIVEFGVDIGLNFPRIFFPFNTDGLIPKSMAPETRFSTGATLQKNIGLDKQTLNGVLRYKWSPSPNRKNFLELINIQYVKNLNTDRYYSVYNNSYKHLNDVASDYTEEANPAYYKNGNLIAPEGTRGFTNDVLSGTINASTEDKNEVSRIEAQRKRLTANNLIYSSNYTYYKNTRKDFNDNNFSQFRGKIEFAGNLLSLLAPVFNFKQDELGNNLLFGVQYSQYVKTEFDYIKYWRLSRNNVLAFRSFFGIAIPYGNSNHIPFIRSYFAGGSNDNRAWQPYSLGPGRTSNVNDFNEANLKLAFNLEYRFNLIGNFKGALFADAGNIWNALDNIDNEAAVFEGLSSLSEIALGTGFGLRYDFNFFVLRFDIGFKTYNPSNEKGERWFSNYNFDNAVYNIGINYPF